MTPSPAPVAARRAGCALAPIIALVAITLCLATGQFFGLLASMLPGGATHGGVVVAYTLPLTLALAIGARRSREPRRQAMLRTWLLATLYPLFTIPAGWPRPVE